jgi:hypothetical protein
VSHFGGTGSRSQLLLQRLSQKALDRFDSPQWADFDFDYGDRCDERGGKLSFGDDAWSLSQILRSRRSFVSLQTPYYDKLEIHQKTLDVNRAGFAGGSNF